MIERIGRSRSLECAGIPVASDYLLVEIHFRVVPVLQGGAEVPHHCIAAALHPGRPFRSHRNQPHRRLTFLAGAPRIRRLRKPFKIVLMRRLSFNACQQRLFQPGSQLPQPINL